MKKIQGLLAPMVVKVKFGNQKVYPIKGILKTIGVSEKGNKWFSLLVGHKISTRTELGNRVPEFYYTERIFSLDSVVEGQEKLLPLFESLEK